MKKVQAHPVYQFVTNSMGGALVLLALFIHIRYSLTLVAINCAFLGFYLLFTNKVATKIYHLILTSFALLLILTSRITWFTILCALLIIFTLSLFYYKCIKPHL